MSGDISCLLSWVYFVIFHTVVFYHLYILRNVLLFNVLRVGLFFRDLLTAIGSSGLRAEFQFGNLQTNHKHQSAWAHMSSAFSPLEDTTWRLIYGVLEFEQRELCESNSCWHQSIHCVTHLYNKYLLSTYNMSFTLLNAVNKANAVSCCQNSWGNIRQGITAACKSYDG